MTFEDMRVVEAHVADLHAGGLPVMLSTEYDRVDVDLTYCRLRADLVRDWLVERTRRLGCLYDFWFPDKEPHHTLCVSEKGVEE